MMTEVSEPSPPERRRYSIRVPRPLWTGIIAIVLLIAAALLPVSLRLHRQIAAIRAIESQGGAVGTVGHRSGRQRELLGYPTFKAFEVVDFVNWEHGVITDSDITQLLELPTLRRLNLRHTRIADAGVMRLKGVPHLELLLLEGSTATDAATDELQRALPGLTIKR
jgi:hypothetical protein